MALLTHDAILAVDDRPTETVPVPEWGGDVMVRGMDGQGRDAYFASMAVQRGKQVTQDVHNATARLVARCIVDPESLEPMFTLEEADILGRKSAAALDRVGNVAARLSGLTEDDMEELKKDSRSTQNGGSTSGSPVTLAAPSAKRSGRSAASSSPSGPSTTG
jgi:hypothetical protein